jgi:hypothetical protein
MGTGDVQAHLAEVYGTNVSRQQISDITDAVVEKMTEWQNRPLDVVYPVIFIDAIHVKIRDGQVANRPIYVRVTRKVVCAGQAGVRGSAFVGRCGLRWVAVRVVARPPGPVAGRCV